MSYRFMRLLVMFDLPNDTTEARRAYRQFRRTLIKNGFFMMQESVYCRMVLNQSIADTVLRTLKKEKPKNGVVQVLSVTEKQFANMEFLVGSLPSEVLATDERLVIL